MIVNFDPCNKYDLDPGRLLSMCGYIPQWISEDVPFRKSLHDNYAHGGGWQPFGTGDWQMYPDGSLKYPGDYPILYPYVEFAKDDETLYVYPHAWVAVVTEDEFEVARID